MSRFLAALLILCLALPFSATASEEALQNCVLLEGERIELTIGNLPLATIDHPDMVKLERHSQNKIIIQALKQGRTQLRFHGGTDKEKIVRLQITSRNLYKEYQEIRHLLEGIHGLTLSLTRSEVVVEGELLLPNDVKKVERVKAEHKDMINLCTFNKEMYQKVTAKYLHSKLEAPTITVKIKDQFLILEGKLPNANEIRKIETRATKLAKISDTHLELNSLLEVEETNIKIKLTFMQINQLDSEKTGFSILETFKAAGDLNWNGPGTPSSNLAINADAQINALVEKAWADVIKRPELTVTSGSETTWQDGDDLIIPGTEKSDTTRVRTGLIIKSTPTLRSNGQIDLKVSVEVSAPTAGPQGSIQITQFLQETQVKCRLGETLILSKLLTSIKHKFKKQTPVLGSIPLLKMLFSNEAKSESQKDLLLLITPTVPSFNKDLVKAQYRFQSLREMLDR